MKRLSIIILLHYFITMMFLRIVFAESNVLINEFLIDPQPQQVEILNIGLQNIDISNWYLDDNGGTTYGIIPQSTILYPNSCYVYTGDLNLNKSSADMIRLFNSTVPPTSSSAMIIDSYSYKSSLGPGTSFLRFPDGENVWISSSSSMGKFNTSNLTCIVLPTSTPSPIPTLTPTPTSSLIIEPSNNPTITPTSTPSPTITVALTPEIINNIYISEVMVHPKTNDKEWIELFNDNDFEVYLENWYIDDLENAGSLPKKFSLNLPSKSYPVVEFSSSIFNDNGDEIRLLDQMKNLVDGFEYNSSIEDMSYGRTAFSSSEFCLQISSKTNLNNSCILPTSSISPTIASKLSFTPTAQQTKKPPPTLNTKSVLKSVLPSNYINNYSYQQPQNMINNVDENILGASTYIGQKNLSKNKLMLTSFISLIYSILTIIYVSIKMKLSYEKSYRFYSSSFYSKRRK